MRNTLAISITMCALLGCSTAAVEAETHEVSSPIIDGQPATADQLFATVALVGVSDGEPLCTGTLVAPTVVITAAHCLFDDEGALGAEDIDVAVGVLDTYAATTEQIYFPSNASGHSGYSDGAEPGPLGRDDDLAVLVLSDPVEGQTPVPVLALDAIDEHVKQGDALTITGYGQRDEAAMDPELVGLLYIAETPYQQRTDHELLAGGEGNPDTCTGDSGGPVYMDIEGTKYLLAAVSRASEAGTPPCGRGGIYTIVSAYDAFLTEETSGAYAGATSPMTAPASSTGSGGSEDGGGEDGDDDDGGCNVGGSPQTSFGWLLLLGLGLRRRASRS